MFRSPSSAPRDALRAEKFLRRLVAVVILACALSVVACVVCAVGVVAQRSRGASASSSEFGPIVRAYLDYLRDQQEVVDDRVSRREVDRRYYVHNSNRITALRQMAIKLARANDNDYLPELEAVSQGEFDQLFDEPLPVASSLKVGELFEYKLRFLGAVVARGEKFYLFARLDPYEQAELRKKAESKAQTTPTPDVHAATPQPPVSNPVSRPRRASIP